MELVVIGNVVGVQTLGARLEIRRSITIADSQLMQIRHEGLRIVEGERAVELQAVGGDRDFQRQQDFTG